MPATSLLICVKMILFQSIILIVVISLKFFFFFVMLFNDRIMTNFPLFRHFL